MRNKGISLLIPVLFLLMLVLVVDSLTSQDVSLKQASFQDEKHSLSLSPYYDAASDQYILFLPAFSEAESLTLSCPWYMNARVFSGDQQISSFPTEEDLTVTVSYLWGGQKDYSLRILSCSASQTVYLEAQEGMLDYIHADQSREREIFVTFLDSSGSIEYRGSTIISGRGNSTWLWDKKPYDLDFSDPVTVGPFTQVERLSLLAEYFDVSKLRNPLGYYVGRAMDFPYATEYAYADVYLNGVYQGLYGIVTKEEYKKHVDSDGIQAVFELSTSGKGHFFYTAGGKAVRMYYGDEYLVYDKIYAMEQALQNQDWDALSQIIDLNSWARKYAMEEFLYNYDMSLTSQYYYLDDSGLIRCMLPWDYDWSLYARLYPLDSKEEYALGAYWNRPNWLDQMLLWEDFRSAVLTVLEEDYSQEFLSGLDAFMGDCISEIGGSWGCDQRRWAASYALSHSTAPDARSLEAHRAHFRSYFPDRLDFLTRLFSDWEGHCLISFYAQYDEDLQPAKLQLILPLGADLSHFHSRIEMSIATPEGYELLGWFLEDGTPMEAVSTVTGDLSLIARYRSLSNGETP